ncbi:MAG: hypothetical protein U0354_16395 [Candidatus Sericytochromatia bacterium]
MRNKEVYRTINKNREEQLQCELCNKVIEQENLIEISNNKDSTILCNSCAVKFNNLASLYDE